MTYNYNNSLLGDYLTPSGEYLVVENPIIIQGGSINDTVIGDSVPSSGNFTNLTVNSTGVSLVGHTHEVGDIIDFNSGVSGLLPSISFGSFINSSFDNNVYTISVSGLQPSGNYSVDGHNHTSSEITDFNSSVSGLLPTINNAANNRILTSDGSSYGIVAQDKLVFDPNYSDFGGIATSSGASLIIKEEVPDTNTPLSSLLVMKMYGRDTFGSACRIQFERYRGTEESPSLVQEDDFLGVIRFLTPNPAASGVAISGNTARMIALADGDAGNGFTPTRLTLNTSSDGDGQFSNNFTIFSDNRITTNCSLSVDEGLSAPTPILSLGSVSGNVSINYGIDKQIQTLTLSGTTTNFIEGDGWNIVDKSIDVLLEITVNTTTTVLWTLVDDLYNPFPSFTPGKYLVLLRSIGTTIQGHYIGEKTN